MKDIKRLAISLFLLLGSTYTSYAQIEPTFCISKNEYQLFKDINIYRKAMGKTPLSLSKSLSFVASKHIEDILVHKSDSNECSDFSWSYGNEGDDCCVSEKETNLLCSRKKPLFLTNYPDIAYEMLFYDDHQADPTNALRFWKSIKQSKDMLLCEGKYSEYQWLAVGIAIQDKYVSLWLGEVPDLDSRSRICGTKDTIEFNIPTELADKIFLSRPDNHYHIVLASAVTMEEIQKKLVKLRNTDMVDLRIISAKDRCRVITGDFKERTEAASELKQYRKFVKDAWIIQY